MLHALYRVGLSAVLFGLMFVPGAAWGQKDARPRHVHDEAKLFSKDAIEQVDKTIAKIKKLHGKDLYIDTVEHGEKDKDARTKWAKKRFNDFAVDGIYIVVSKEPSFYRWFVGDNTREKGYFTKADIDKMDENLKSITIDGKRDEALIEAANYTLEVMNEHGRTKGNVAPPKQKAAAENPPAPKHQPVAHQDLPENTLPPWVGWVCMIVAVLVVVWVVFAIIRAMTGAMSGGGGGYGGGGFGGGGGGFLTGMLGGLFGSMAGMWLYNNMFGGHANYNTGDWGGGGNQGTTGSAGEPYEADTAEGGTGGGRDADDNAGGGGGGDDGGGDAGGGDAGGGDAGGGGGWFGGGGGDAGGGDAGGGGGDWGGGGGGDFGGGGGGGDW